LEFDRVWWSSLNALRPSRGRTSPSPDLSGGLGDGRVEGTRVYLSECGLKTLAVILDLVRLLRVLGDWACGSAEEKER
jgi:hypothetical protein